MKIDIGQTFTLSANLSLPINEKLEVYGKLIFDPNKSVKLSVKAIWNFGEIIMMPANKDIDHHIHIYKTDENKFVGGGMDPVDSDPGIWNMGAGVMKLKGYYKKSWTTAKGGIVAGAKSVFLNDVTGWEIGDEIVIDPTEIPLNGTLDEEILKKQSVQFDKITKTYSDPYLKNFERRIITGILGTQVSFDKALEFNHHTIVAEPDLLYPQGETAYPFVANNTRNVKISGDPAGRAHIFSCSHSKNADGSTAHNHQVQQYENVEFFELGPRKYDINLRGGLMGTILGRYVHHFHHGGDGSRGTIIKGCAYHDNYSRCFVPHLSYGIEFSENSVFNNLSEMMWVDFQEQTHDLKFHRNLGSAIKWDKIQEGGSGVLIGMGDNNSYIGNRLVYANQGDPKGSGAYQWTADNEGVAIPFFDNIAMCCHCANWTWQNSGNPHAEVQFEAWNCNYGLSHGAYGNLYMYSRCGFYRSYLHLKASGATFHHCVFNGLGKLDHPVHVETSAVGGVNLFAECEFKGYTGVASELDLHPHNDIHAQPRQVELVNGKYTGAKVRLKPPTGGKAPVANSYFKIQDGNTAVRVDQNGTSAIGKFAPDKFGKGDGVKGEYYEGINFDKKIFERVDASVNFGGWAVDLPKQTGIHHKLNTVPFSVRYTGQIEPYYSGAWGFRLNGASGFRLWIDNKLLIDSPGNKHSNAEFTDSGTINLNALQKYPIKIEVYDPGDKAKGILFYWKHASTGNNFVAVPMSQLYSGVTAPVPPVDPIDPIPPVQDPCKIFVEKDYLEFPQNKDVKDAVAIGQFSSGLDHYNKYGKAEGRPINRLCPATPMPQPPIPNTPPTASAGIDNEITLPVNSVTLIGTGADKEGSVTFAWSKISGTGGTIVTPTAKDTLVSGLTEGDYVFRLTVTDAGGLKTTDDVKITVKPALPPVPIIEEFELISTTGKKVIYQDLNNTLIRKSSA